MTRDLPPKPAVRRNLTTPIIRSVIAAAAAITLVCTTISPATADELDTRKDQLKQELAQQSEVVADAHDHRNEAVEALKVAQTQLADAEASLAHAESEARQAAELDAQRAKELADAEVELEKAEADVAAALAALDSVNSRINEEILVTTQTSHGLLNLALLFDDVDTSNLNQRAQLAETLFDSSARELDEAEMRRLKLEDAEAAAEAAKTKAEAARAAAADQLAAKVAAEAKAEAVRGDVAERVRVRDAAAVAAGQQVAQAEQRQAALEAENRDVEKRIQERIAREKAAAEKARLEKIAQQKAEQSRKDQAARQSRAAQRPPAPAAKPAVKPKAQQSGSGFIMPSGARITSRYGMRLHPVLGYWKLHDGTDFGASCGSPIRAAAAGVVSERYYNGGYGNRLMIDHGRINGDYVTTGYNHATRYIVGVGQRVSKGQLIGYVGSTGYSTGCHLHLMVWENGRVVNPMAKWFG